MAKYNADFLLLAIIIITCLMNGFGLDSLNREIIQRRNFVRNFCVARCNIGRGGNVCRCNGFHFAGKRGDPNEISSSSVTLNSIPGQLIALLNDQSQVQNQKSDANYKESLLGESYDKMQDNSQIRDDDLRLVLSILLREIVEGRSDELLAYLLEQEDGRQLGQRTDE